MLPGDIFPKECLDPVRSEASFPQDLSGVLAKMRRRLNLYRGRIVGTIRDDDHADIAFARMMPILEEAYVGQVRIIDQVV